MAQQPARSTKSVWFASSPNKPSSAGFCPTFGFSGSTAFRFATSASETFSVPGMTYCSPGWWSQFLLRQALKSLSRRRNIRKVPAQVAAGAVLAAMQRFGRYWGKQRTSREPRQYVVPDRTYVRSCVPSITDDFCGAQPHLNRVLQETFQFFEEERQAGVLLEERMVLAR